MKLTVCDIINKRQTLWGKYRDLNYDKDFVKAAVVKILSTKELTEEVNAKPYLLIEVAFYIVNKKSQTVPFFLNEVQKDIVLQIESNGNNKPFYILKGRQQGVTSLITAMQLCYIIVRKNFAGFTIADKADNTKAIFNDKARVVLTRLPKELQPHEKFNSQNEIFFDKLNSSWRIATATDQVGRSRTLNFVHFSEIAFFECQLANMQKSIGEAITQGGTVVYETTANGFNEAKDLWDSNSCINLFYEWWKSKEYTSTEYEYLDTNDSWLVGRKKLLEDKGLSKEQIAWYCKKYNGYLDKNTIRQEYPCSAEEAFISSGYSVFGTERVNELILKVGKTKGRRGSFEYRQAKTPEYMDGQLIGTMTSLEDIKFIESEGGFITLHEEPKTKKDQNGDVISYCPYAIGGDTSGSGQDYYTAKVVNAISGNTVATLRVQRVDEDEYTRQVLCLAKYYNNAVIGIETNYSLSPMRDLKQVYSYPNLYLRQKYDKIADKTELVLGFDTTRKSKPIIIGNLVKEIRENDECECDIDTLKEMLTFVRKDNGSQEALAGYHDDLVMAKAIAHAVMSQASDKWIELESAKRSFIDQNFKVQNEDGFGFWED